MDQYTKPTKNFAVDSSNPLGDGRTESVTKDCNGKTFVAPSKMADQAGPDAGIDTGNDQKDGSHMEQQYA